MIHDFDMMFGTDMKKHDLGAYTLNLNFLRNIHLIGFTVHLYKVRVDNGA